ncbi:MAG: hypothetical protein IAX21_11740 [Candidatus Bathyarchaeota archaeon]|nr:hypothetical protein [Candidatus Bathyarchaeum tardum]WGM88450.1 MAG: hypothetical protein NUK63_05865 [Candidatus Bathyarchaeum tardum]WNZ29278.1 MAG: hypothetical protein IAX21_11740 [Candidatus Bathyarchaeota archaeon]
MSNSTTDIYIPSVGNIKTLEVEAYTDSAYANKIDQISWDTLEPGKTVNTTIYIKSVSNVEITLDIHLTDWVPSNLSKYITISWDYDGSSLNPREGIPVTLMLSASSSDDFIYYLVENEVQNFNVDVHFVGSA